MAPDDAETPGPSNMERRFELQKPTIGTGNDGEPLRGRFRFRRSEVTKRYPDGLTRLQGNARASEIIR
jgi:hypothetical protein